MAFLVNKGTLPVLYWKPAVNIYLSFSQNNVPLCCFAGYCFQNWIRLESKAVFLCFNVNNI